MAKVLLTGGVGYIGSHTLVELIENGFDVVVIDNLSNSNLAALEGVFKITGVKIEFEKIDLCDFNQTKSFFERHNDIDAVIHFASYKAVGESVEFPLMYYRNNLIAMINLMECLANYNSDVSLVFSSSCSVYGNPESLPVKESHGFGIAQSPYASSKQMSENIIQDTIKVNLNIKAISLRYFNPIGAHPSGFIGESPLKTYNLIPILTKVATGKLEKIKVFGNDYATHDGTCVRDYIHVVDIAEAHVEAVKRLLSSKNKDSYEFFNLGLGKGFSVLDIIKSFESVSGKKINFEIVERRAGDVDSVYADSSLAEKELDWKAKFELNDMLNSAWLWESEKRYY